MPADVELGALAGELRLGDVALSASRRGSSKRVASIGDKGHVKVSLLFGVARRKSGLIAPSTKVQLAGVLASANSWD